jgi:predicted DNA-binding protein YlxM (UPF0122 family)
MTDQQLWQLAESVMTPNQYQAFWLHHHESISVRKIAKGLGISRSAVRDRIESGTLRLQSASETRKVA